MAAWRRRRGAGGAAARPARRPPARLNGDNGAPNGRRDRPRPPGGLRDPRRPAADRRLRRGGARPRARHARLRRSPRTTCAPARGPSPARWPRTTTAPGDVVFASKALPCTPVLRLFAEEGLGCDVASGGELHLALHAGFAPERIYLHGNAKSRAELRDGRRGGRRHDRARQRRGRAAAGRAARRPQSQRVLLRVTPGVDADTHEAILTGQAGSKFGFAPDDARALIADPPAGPRDRRPAHAPRLPAVRARALPARDPRARRRSATSGPTTSAAASASRTPRTTRSSTSRPGSPGWSRPRTPSSGSDTRAGARAGPRARGQRRA